jgi:hypothetical protein
LKFSGIVFLAGQGKSLAVRAQRIQFTHAFFLFFTGLPNRSRTLSFQGNPESVGFRSYLIPIVPAPRTQLRFDSKRLVTGPR